MPCGRSTLRFDQPSAHAALLHFTLAKACHAHASSMAPGVLPSRSFPSPATLQVSVPGAELQEVIPAARLLQTATSLSPVEYERAKQAFLHAAKASRIEAQVRAGAGWGPEGGNGRAGWNVGWAADGIKGFESLPKLCTMMSDGFCRSLLLDWSLPPAMN